MFPYLSDTKRHVKNNPSLCKRRINNANILKNNDKPNNCLKNINLNKFPIHNKVD